MIVLINSVISGLGYGIFVAKSLPKPMPTSWWIDSQPPLYNSKAFYSQFRQFIEKSTVLSRSRCLKYKYTHIFRIITRSMADFGGITCRIPSLQNDTRDLRRLHLSAWTNQWKYFISSNYDELLYTTLSKSMPVFRLLCLGTQRI